MEEPRSRSRTTRELLLFGVVGIANTATGYAVFALCLYLGWPYQVAAMVSMLASILVGFIGQGKFVFMNLDSRRIVRYIVMWAGLLLVFNLVVKVAMAVGYSAYVGGLVALPLIIPLSFMAQKYFVFRR